MVSTLVVGTNTYGTLAEANTYLGDSPRAFELWPDLSTDERTLFLIAAFRKLELLAWNGANAALKTVATATLSAAGTGYVANEVLTVSGGTFGRTAQIKVLTVSGGAIATFEVIDVGAYSVAPDPLTGVATTASASGTGATFDLTMQTQTANHPRTGMTDCNSNELVADDFAGLLKEAQFELAFELSQDAALETSGGQASNIKKVEAAGNVTFFRPTSGDGGGQPFPSVIWDKIKCFATQGGGGVNCAPEAPGTDTESAFDDCDTYGLNSPLP